MPTINRIPKQIFDYIEGFIPFSSVDIIIVRRNEGIILTRRAIRPYLGWWHLPGSVVLKNEKMVETVRRSASEELGITTLSKPRFIGNYELFTARRHYITHLYLAECKFATSIKLDGQSSEFMITTPDKLPKKLIPIQRQMLKDAVKMGYL